MLLTRLATLFSSRSATLASVGLGILLASGTMMGGCTAAEVSPEAPVAEAPARLPAFRSSQPATAIDALTDGQVDNTITISGKIAQKSAVLDGWLYQVQDETGSLWVLSDRDAPDVGESVTVEGAVRYEPIVVGDLDVSEFYLEETDQQTPDR